MADREEPVRGRTLKEYVGVVLRGFCMGAADVVPGVSGGTMAFITGIYEELLFSIRSVNLDVGKKLLQFRFKEAVSAIRWQFLVALLFGILTAIVSLARGIKWLLENEPVLLWAFFFGLVAASVCTVQKQVRVWNAVGLVGATLSAVFAYVLVGLVPVETSEAAWFVFLCGVIAICAMILPGISGSFILVLLGKYQYLLGAVNDRNLLPLVAFAAGAVVGITSFARVLGWIFRRYHDLAVAMLTGLMVGSLRKIWPWKETLSTYLNRHGKEVPLEQVNMLPAGFDGEVIFAIGLAFLGFALVMAMDRFAERKPQG